MSYAEPVLNVKTFREARWRHQRRIQRTVDSGKTSTGNSTQKWDKRFPSSPFESRTLERASTSAVSIETKLLNEFPWNFLSRMSFDLTRCLSCPLQLNGENWGFLPYYHTWAVCFFVGTHSRWTQLEFLLLLVDQEFPTQDVWMARKNV